MPEHFNKKPHYKKYFNRRYSKKKKRPNFIYKGDLCFFEKPFEVFPADRNFNFNSQVARIIWPGEHLVYIKRKRDKDSGAWLHCFESYGLNYVFSGSIKELTKKTVPYKENCNYA